MPDCSRAPRRLAVVIAGLLAAGCHVGEQVKQKVYDSTRKIITSSYHDPDAEAKMTKAEGLFNDGKYKDAEPILADLADNTYNPVLLCEKARYLESESLRLQNKQWDAVSHYNRLLQDHPAGAYRERAATRLYEISYEWLKDGTLAEIEAELAGKRPAWWQRAPKLPSFGDSTHPPLDQEGEALKYMEAAHTHDLTGPTADKALFWCGYVNFYRGRYDEADSFFSQIVELHKDSRLWQEACRLAIISKNNSTGGAVYDSTKAAEALQLVHQVQAIAPEFARDKEKGEWLNRQTLAVRMQLAEKDFRTAEYYERTNHPASANFYYDLVTRRYPGTKFADLAKARMTALEVIRRDHEANPVLVNGQTPFDGVGKAWGRLVDRVTKPTAGGTVAPPTGPTGPGLAAIPGAAADASQPPTGR